MYEFLSHYFPTSVDLGAGDGAGGRLVGADELRPVAIRFCISGRADWQQDDYLPPASTGFRVDPTYVPTDCTAFPREASRRVSWTDPPSAGRFPAQTHGVVAPEDV